AELYVGIFWKRLGRYTLDEFSHAKELHIDCLIYEKWCQEGEREPELTTFLNQIRQVETGLTNRLPFVDPDELERYIHLDVDRWRTSRVRESRKHHPDRVFQAPPPGNHHIKRSALQDRLVASLLGGDGPRVTRAALHGSPGIGKSMLAGAIAHDEALER